MSFQPKMGKDRMTKDLLLKIMDEDWRELFRKGMECLFYFLIMFQGKGYGQVILCILTMFTTPIKQDERKYSRSICAKSVYTTLRCSVGAAI